MCVENISPSLSIPLVPCPGLKPLHIPPFHASMSVGTALVQVMFRSHTGESDVCSSFSNISGCGLTASTLLLWPLTSFCSMARCLLGGMISLSLAVEWP